jgi:hypothetical protein
MCSHHTFALCLQCGKGKVVKVTGIANQGRTAIVLLRMHSAANGLCL